MTTDFIETYDDILSPEFCQHIIEKFENSSKKAPGSTGHGVNTVAKNSIDINISLQFDWSEEHKKIVELTKNALNQYIRKYSYLLTGAVTLSFLEPVSNTMITVNREVMDMVGDDSITPLIGKMYRLGTINIQKYEQNVGGYYHWHSENYPQKNDPKCEALHRVLLFMYYLNDVNEGGETEFYYQEKRFKPKRGQLLIAPSSFTHTHKGNIPVSNDKYILTSWVLFQKAKDLYG